MAIPGLPGGLIIYQGHLFPLKGHPWAELVLLDQVTARQRFRTTPCHKDSTPAGWEHRNLGVAHNYKTGVTQVLVYFFIYKGSI